MLSEFIKKTEDTKSEIEETSGPGRDVLMVYFIFGVFLAVAAILITVFTLEKTKEMKIASLNDQIKQEVTDPLLSLAADEQQVKTVSNQLDTLTAAISNKQQYSKLISDLAAGLFKNSSWKSFNLTGSQISISATCDNFLDVARTVASLRTVKSVKDVKLASSNINSDTSKVEFSLNIIFDPSYYLSGKTTVKNEQ